MSKKAEVINLERLTPEQSIKKRLQLDSGRQILIHSDKQGERLEIVEPEGDSVVTIRLTDAGPVVTVRGGHLELKGTESLSLEAKKIKIKAREKAVIESGGRLEIDSSEKLDIHSREDVRVVGKLIHLN
jgi:hypothetical protein